MQNLCNGTLLLSLITLFISQIHFGYAQNASDHSYSAGCIDREREALMKFRKSLVDEANRLSSWTGKDCCNWIGITCNNVTGHVEKFDLHNPFLPSSDDAYSFHSPDYAYSCNKCLGGEVNPSLLDLEKLQYMDLSSNNFSGIRIPTFLGSLRHMKYLSLASSGFCGEIPRHLGNLSNLQYLYLGASPAGGGTANALTAKNLEWITHLSGLKVLDLAATNLYESLDWLYSVNMLPSLSSLKLRRCELASLVPPLRLVGNLTSSLVSLDLGENGLNSTLPLWLFNLTSLAVLKLDSNYLHGLFANTLERLTSLTLLDLYVNYFSSSSILDSMCNGTSLTSIDVSENELQGSLPLCLGNLTSLRIFNAGSNNLAGNIPGELGYLRELSFLDLSYNSLQSSIPSTFGQLTKLKTLSLSKSQLYGTVPSNIGKLNALQELDISDNLLTGELSESHFSKLISLKSLWIFGNFLAIKVSPQWIPPFQLRDIEMDSVLVGTEFPTWLQTQRNLLALTMRNASIFGAIPYELFLSGSSSNHTPAASLVPIPPKMKALDLSGNFLTWPNVTTSFDANYTKKSSLTYLNLNNSNLAGNIPHFLCNLSSLQTLYLSYNQLTGSIPLCFGNLQELQTLTLTNNSLSGHIPSILGSLRWLSGLHLNRNMLCGRLPSSLKNLKWLVDLDLSENQLTDTIPEWIGKELSNLQTLKLQSNNFYGNISTRLCQLSSLQTLNLARNKLTGNIPQCFND